MSKVVNLHAERWVDSVFDESDLRVDVSTKGRIRFTVGSNIYDEKNTQTTILTMEQMASLGEAISIAFRDEEDENG
jgi:hypothetical protein